MKKIEAMSSQNFPLKANPRKNLPQKVARKRGESNFVLAFARAFVKKIGKSVVIAARELPVRNYGIADLVCLIELKNSSVHQVLPKHKRARVTFLAFELKIKDWRGALSQAFAYKFYANTAIVVLPLHEVEKAKKYIKTFQRLQVGLWSFDKKTRTIYQIYTPTHRKPIHPVVTKKAISILLPDISRFPQFA